MTDANHISELMRRVRAGDQAAATTLVREYEPLVRRMVRLRLEDERLSRVFDSMDVCQSVLGSFFVRAAMGEYDLQEPGQLVKLLVTMARNKVASAARREYRQKRDRRRTNSDEADALDLVAGRQETPSQILMGNELIDRARGLLRAEELEMSELRANGLSWDDIAAKLGGTAQARRVQFMRAMERVTRELGFEESSG